MAPDKKQGYEQHQFFEGLLEEKYISFNIRRSVHNHSPFPRKVTLLDSSRLRKTVIPGIIKHKERSLIEELNDLQNWKFVEKYSFQLPPFFFSFLWRFKTLNSQGLDYFKDLKPLDKKVVKKIKVAYRKYQAYLRSKLAAGQIYLIPDAEVTFNRPNRYKQIYSRRVLVLSARTGQVVMIPFSSKLGRMDKKYDILFDSCYRGKRLDSYAMPAVENFPYRTFNTKVSLCVSKAQPIGKEKFLESALISKGAVNKDLLNFIHAKLKNI